MTSDDSFLFSERFDVAKQTWTVERVERQDNGRSELAPWVEVRPSMIKGAGDGVFASRPFRKGERVGIYAGEIALESAKSDDADYLFQLEDVRHSETLVVDGAVGGNWTGKINDGSTRCNPKWRRSRCNVVFSGFNSVEATRNIRAGEELYVSYGASYWKQASATSPK